MLDVLKSTGGAEKNPKLNDLINDYKSEIEAGNIDFFINKDYSQDVSNAANSDKIMESIDRLRAPVKNMGPENQAKVMKYIQNLTKLAQMCE